MLTAQKKIFSLAGMSPKSSNMTAKSDINTADTSKVYHLLVVGAGALTMSEITVDGVSVEKVSGCAREFLVVDDLFCSCSDSTKTFVHARDVNEMSAMYCASGASNSEFSESIKKSLPLCGNTVYGYKAPHKTGAGIGVLVNRMATYDAPSVFFYVVGLTHPFFGRWCIIQRLCQSMVAQAGASSEAPVSIRAGYANPVWATTSEIGVSGGSVTCYRMEAATCWLLPLPKNRNLSGLSPQFAAIARQLPPKFIILLPSLNAMLAVLWCAITSAFLLVVSAWRWHMIKTYDVHMDPLERTSQIITLTEVINDILVSNSPSRDEKLKALLAILDLAVRDVHFLLEGGQMPCKTGAISDAAAFSMRSTSPSIRESIDFSGCPSFMRIASTSQEVLSPPEARTDRLNSSCNSDGMRNATRLDLLIAKTISVSNIHTVYHCITLLYAQISARK